MGFQALFLEAITDISNILTYIVLICRHSGMPGSLHTFHYPCEMFQYPYEINKKIVAVEKLVLSD